ncbi:MAG TPA: hypothetical protein VFF75_08620 [Methylophilaceae bacterium]|nr:hypothetical protein [Methylophilaceae bacterium]
MKSRMYYLLLAAVTATFLTACDRTDDNATQGDTSAPAAGSAGGVGTNDMGTGTGAESTTSPDPATEIPNSTEPQSQDSGTTSNTDPNTTNTNP